MPKGPAARLTDPVVHPLPPVLQPGPGSMNVLIGMLKAWRGIPLAAVAALQAAKQAADTAIQVAVAATAAAAGTPGAPAAYAAEQATKAACLASMASAISGAAASGADIHLCTTPVPVPPHGPGVVIDGDRDDQQPAGVPGGRYDPGGDRASQQDRHGMHDGDHRAVIRSPHETTRVRHHRRCCRHGQRGCG